MTPHSNRNGESSVDTILTLPERVGAIAIAESCRATALAFMNESRFWGKPELAMWLMGPYGQLTQYVAPLAERRNGEYVAPRVPMLREIDVRMVERVIKSAHEEVMATLDKLLGTDAASAFAFTMINAGFVARCEDKSKVSGWVPTSDARRLADRVLSLFAVDYLTNPSDFESDLSVCPRCKNVEFDAFARMRGRCSRHGNSMAVSRTHFSTMPYLPEHA